MCGALSEAWNPSWVIKYRAPALEGSDQAWGATVREESEMRCDKTKREVLFRCYADGAPCWTTNMTPPPGGLEGSDHVHVQRYRVAPPALLPPTPSAGMVLGLRHALPELTDSQPSPFHVCSFLSADGGWKQRTKTPGEGWCGIPFCLRRWLQEMSVFFQN